MFMYSLFNTDVLKYCYKRWVFSRFSSDWSEEGWR